MTGHRGRSRCESQAAWATRGGLGGSDSETLALVRSVAEGESVAVVTSRTWACISFNALWYGVSMPFGTHKFALGFNIISLASNFIRIVCTAVLLPAQELCTH